MANTQIKPRNAAETLSLADFLADNHWPIYSIYNLLFLLTIDSQPSYEWPISWPILAASTNPTRPPAAE
jgi:hypothetical protein